MEVERVVEVTETPVEVGEREERVFYWKVKLKWKEKWAHGLPAWMDEVSMIWAIRLNLWLRIEELHTISLPLSCIRQFKRLFIFWYSLLTCSWERERERERERDTKSGESGLGAGLAALLLPCCCCLSLHCFTSTITPSLSAVLMYYYELLYIYIYMRRCIFWVDTW